MQCKIKHDKTHINKIENLNNKSSNIGIQKIKGLVFNIERYAIHDGPGIRTLVFMKGCSLRCLWCDNPEGQSRKPQLMFFPGMCISCRYCVNVCPKQATYFSKQGTIEIDRKLCVNCGECTRRCYAGARTLCGKYMTVGEVLNEVLKDDVFYQNTGGGVTLSGGEPAMQAEFSRLLLKACKEKQIDTAVETSGYATWGNFRRVLEFTDLVLFDLKCMNAEKHHQLTGKSNNLILTNLRRLSRETNISTIVRRVIVPGYNDSKEDIEFMCEFIIRNGLRIKKLEFLPFHNLGLSKYKILGKNDQLEKVNSPTREQIEELKQVAFRYNLEAEILE